MIDFEVRKSIFQALNNNAEFAVTGVPVFDSIVNPNVAIPTINNMEVYAVIQSPQTQAAGLQNMCNERLAHSITIRVVTKSSTGGVVSGITRDEIAGLILKAIRPERGDNNLVSDTLNIHKVDYPIIQNMDEFSNNQTALSKILIFTIYLNKN